MNIITKDQLAETLVNEIIKPLHDQWLMFPDGFETFDDYLWAHTQELGAHVYTIIGERYGDCDDAASVVLGD